MFVSRYRAISIVNLKDIIAGIANFLDATGMILSVKLDFKWQSEVINDDFNRMANEEFRAFFNNGDF